MIKTGVENTVCDTCGADVRAEALFCYNCGGALSGAAESDEASVERPVTAIDPQPNGRENAAATVLEDRPVSPADTEVISADAGQTKLRSASDLRRRMRTYRGPVKIAWEPPEKSSAVFVAATILLALLTVLLLVLALSFR